MSELNDSLNKHRVVLLYGLPGSGKSFLAERARSSSFEKITELPPFKKLKAATAYWFDAPNEKEIAELKRTIARGDQSWLITSRQRLDIKDANLMNLRALDQSSALEIFSAELERRGLLDSVDPEKILPFLLGNPLAISKAVAFLEINGADELGVQLKEEGYAFDPFLKDQSKRFWEQISFEGQQAMRTASVFSSFTSDNLEKVFGISSSALSELFDFGLIERSSDSARFHINAYAKMLTNRLSAPDKKVFKRHGKWALVSQRANEIRFASENNAGTELGIRCLSWLVENGVPFDSTLLEKAVQKCKSKNYRHSANLFYAHASRRLADGESQVLRNHILDCDHDVAVTEEMHALLAKTEQRYDEALLHYTNCLDHDLSTSTRQRVENNRIAVLWESGRHKDAIDAARKCASTDNGKSGAVALSNLAVMLHNEEDFEAAYLSYEKAEALHSKLGNQRYLAITHFDLGTLAHEQGQFLAALAYHQQAETVFEKLEEKRFLTLNGAAIASIKIALFGRQEKFSFGDAKQKFAVEKDNLFHDAIGLYEKISDAYEKIRLRKKPDVFDYKLYAQSPDELRVQARILRQLSTELTLVCNTTGSLFSTKSDEVMLLNGRSQEIFFNFVTRHLEGKKEIQIDGIAKAGWPDEVMTMKSAKNRVHVALTTLRNAGLKEVLQTTKKGYRLGLVREKDCVALFVFPNCDDIAV